MAYQQSRSARGTPDLLRWRQRVERLGRAVGFWLAVALPLVYLPLLALPPAWLADPAALGSLVGVNLFALVVGHGHEPDFGRRSSR